MVALAGLSDTAQPTETTPLLLEAVVLLLDALVELELVVELELEAVVELELEAVVELELAALAELELLAVEELELAALVELELPAVEELELAVVLDEEVAPPFAEPLLDAVVWGVPLLEPVVAWLELVPWLPPLPFEPPPPQAMGPEAHQIAATIPSPFTPALIMATTSSYLQGAIRRPPIQGKRCAGSRHPRRRRDVARMPVSGRPVVVFGLCWEPHPNDERMCSLRARTNS
jgi:hypothetical protein